MLNLRDAITNTQKEETVSTGSQPLDMNDDLLVHWGHLLPETRYPHDTTHSQSWKLVVVVEVRRAIPIGHSHECDGEPHHLRPPILAGVPPSHPQLPMEPSSHPFLLHPLPLPLHPHLPLPHPPPLPPPPPTPLPHTPQAPHRPPQPRPPPMSLGCALTALSHTPQLHWIICLPPNTRPNGPLFFWAYAFYLSKILEFLDTLFIVLSRSFTRLTFLHVYHHATVLLMCYLWLQTSQSLFPVALVTNASVHVLMYGYYFLSALGIRPGWKRVVTDCQIVQFLFSFAVSGLMLYHHFYGSGCSGMWGWCFNAVFNASLLALFVNFHLKSYASRKKKKHAVKES